MFTDHRFSTHITESDGRRAAQRATIRECVAFWNAEMKALAEKHLAAVAQIDILGDDAEKQIASLAKKIKVAHRLILQQSDIRWGTSVTNSAVEHFHLSATCFRMNLNK